MGQDASIYQECQCNERDLYSSVDQAPQGRQIKNIRVAAWSKAHQENLYWYSATPSGMHTEITVSANNHGNEAGNYTTHVYVDYKDGGS